MEAGAVACASACLRRGRTDPGSVRALVSWLDDISKDAILIVGMDRMTFNAGTHSCMYVSAAPITPIIVLTTLVPQRIQVFSARDE